MNKKLMFGIPLAVLAIGFAVAIVYANLNVSSEVTEGLFLIGDNSVTFDTAHPGETVCVTKHLRSESNADIPTTLNFVQDTVGEGVEYTSAINPSSFTVTALSEDTPFDVCITYSTSTQLGQVGGHVVFAR